MHHGNIVNVTLTPAEENTGIIFKRTDISCDSIQASLENVFDTRLSTSLSSKSAKISNKSYKTVFQNGNVFDFQLLGNIEYPVLFTNFAIY